MPVELRDLLNNERWVPVRSGDFEFQVAYRPSNTSLVKHIEIDQKMRELKARTDLGEEQMALEIGALLCRMVSNWDLTLDGVPLPITAETVTNVLPEELFTAIMEAISNDGKARQEEKKALSASLAAGSLQRDSLAVAQNGIPSSERRGSWA